MEATKNYNGVTASGDVAVAVLSTYVSKASETQKERFSPLSKSANIELFIWTYRIVVSNDSESEFVLSEHDIRVIGEDGIIRQVDIDTKRNKLAVISPGSIFESNEIIAMPCRSGVLCGECKFLSKDGALKKIVKISPVSLDSADSAKMAN